MPQASPSPQLADRTQSHNFLRNRLIVAAFSPLDFNAAASDSMPQPRISMLRLDFICRTLSPGG
jgi:hypothetical protein